MKEVEQLIAEARGVADGRRVNGDWMFPELLNRLADALEATLWERDAAVAAVDRVRSIHQKRGASWPHNGGVYVCGADNSMWPCPTVQALDGAPEPEWQYGLQDADGFVSFRNLSLKSLRKRAKQTGEVIVRRRPASKWLPVEGERK